MGGFLGFRLVRVLEVKNVGTDSVEGESGSKCCCQRTVQKDKDGNGR